MKLLAITLAMLPVTVLAHGSDTPHVHPHGFDLGIAALIAIVGIAAFGAGVLLRRNRRR